MLTVPPHAPRPQLLADAHRLDPEALRRRVELPLRLGRHLRSRPRGLLLLHERLGAVDVDPVLVIPVVCELRRPGLPIYVGHAGPGRVGQDGHNVERKLLEVRGQVGELRQAAEDRGRIGAVPVSVGARASGAHPAKCWVVSRLVDGRNRLSHERGVAVRRDVVV